jgi:predicted nucleic acid-binding protein
MGRTGTDDPVDAIVAQSAARRGDIILTSDPDDLQRLADDLGTIRVRGV